MYGSLLNAALLLAALSSTGLAHAATNAAIGRRVVALAPVPRLRIELANQQWHSFGKDFEASLTTTLVNDGRFNIVDIPPKRALDRSPPSDARLCLGRLVLALCDRPNPGRCTELNDGYTRQPNVLRI